MNQVIRRSRLVAVSAALLIAGCGTLDPQVTSGDILHVHDLVLSSDGSVALATHLGLYKIQGPDSAILVSEDRHDFMAMALNTDGSLIASGHPDLRIERWRVDGRNPHMGLAASSDDGRSWSALSLLGESDFHSISVSGSGRTVGADATSGTVLGSSNQLDWEILSEISVVDLSINANDDSLVVAVEEDTTLRVSNDGGRTWDFDRSAPPFVRAQWFGDEIIGVDKTGQFWMSADSSWDPIGGVPGSPVAFYSTESGETWVATESFRVFHRLNFSSEFNLIYSAPEE